MRTQSNRLEELFVRLTGENKPRRRGGERRHGRATEASGAGAADAGVGVAPT